MPWKGIVGLIEELQRSSWQLSLDWRIHRFLYLTCGPLDYYDSPRFYLSEACWYMRVFPNLKSLRQVALFLCRDDADASTRSVNVALGVKGSEVKRELETEFEKDGRLRVEDLCFRDELSQQKRKLMPDGALIVRCEMKIRGSASGKSIPPCHDALQTDVQFIDSSTLTHGSQTAASISPCYVALQTDVQFIDSSTLTDGSQTADKKGIPPCHVALQTDVQFIDSSTLTDRSQTADKQGIPPCHVALQTDVQFIDSSTLTDGSKTADKQGGEKALLKDFGQLLASGAGSDATMKVGSVEFRVHRDLLSARSPVLSAIFRNNNSASDSIEISDCLPDIFKEYLQYLYAGSMQSSLTEQNAFDLYGLADKYLSSNLKQECLKHIQSALSVRTFCRVVKLALRHGESELLQLATDFASGNLRSIVWSAEWQDFVAECPREANEIVMKCIKP